MYIDTCRLGDLKQQFSFQNLTITNLATGLCITTMNDTMGIGSVPVGLAFCTNSSSQQFYFGSTNRICASFLDGECLTVDARFKNAYFWSPPDLS
eukprot:gene3147-5894_t